MYECAKMYEISQYNNFSPPPLLRRLVARALSPGNTTSTLQKP